MSDECTLETSLPALLRRVLFKEKRPDAPEVDVALVFVDRDVESLELVGVVV